MPSLARFSDKIKRAKRIRQRFVPGWAEPFGSKPGGQIYVRKLDVGLRIAELYHHFPDVHALPDLADLPERCVIKPIAGNGNRGVFALDGGYCHMSCSPVTREDIVSAFENDPTIARQSVLVEEFIRCAVKKTGLPRDYKFYNFGPTCAFIHIVERNSRKDQRKNRHFFVGEDLSPYPHQIQKTQVHSTDELILPDCFEKMLHIAKTVSGSLWSFARVDLYADENGPVFGELADFPHGGNGYLDDADLVLGKLWRGIDGANSLDFIRYVPTLHRLVLS